MQTVHHVSSTQTEILTSNLSNKSLGCGVPKLFLKQSYNNYGGLVRVRAKGTVSGTCNLKLLYNFYSACRRNLRT
jgi:hypothetical protein